MVARPDPASIRRREVDGCATAALSLLVTLDMVRIHSVWSEARR